MAPTKPWRPDDDGDDGDADDGLGIVDGVDALLGAARAELDEPRLRGSLVQLALDAWHAHDGAPEAARQALRSSVAAAKAALWGEAEAAALDEAAAIHQGDLRRLHRALADGPAAGRSFVEVVAQYHLVPSESRKPARAAAAPRKRSRHAMAAGLDELERINSLSDMLSMGLLTAGDAVLSVTCCGVLFLADLLPSGKIRHTPPAGGPAQLFETPAGFVRAVRFSSGITVRPLPLAPTAPAPARCPSLLTPHPPPRSPQGLPVQAWRALHYKGVSLDVLRDAPLSEEAALAAVMAQSSNHFWGGTPPPARGSSGSTPGGSCDELPRGMGDGGGGAGGSDARAPTRTSARTRGSAPTRRTGCGARCTTAGCWRRRPTSRRA